MWQCDVGTNPISPDRLCFEAQYCGINYITKMMQKCWNLSPKHWNVIDLESKTRQSRRIYIPRRRVI